MSTPPSAASRRSFFKTAATIAGGVAASTVACAPTEDTTAGTRTTGIDRTTLEPLAEVVLPAELGAEGRGEAVDAFVRWVNGYEPVAQEMVGYGYSDIRYLPPDPAPAWRAQLDALDLLAHKVRRAPFASLDVAGRTEVVTLALGSERGERLPAPLNARHVAVALLSHWASSPGAWNLALGVEVSPGACRPLEGATPRPTPIGRARA
jgi:hypothetical protein